MSHLGALVRLRQRLKSAMAPTAALRSQPWVDPKPMRDALKAVERDFDGVGGAPPTQSILTAVECYLQATRPVGFKDLKYTCYGITLPLSGAKSRMVDLDDAFKRLLREVDSHRDEGRRFRRCYQGLLKSYFAYPSIADQPPSVSQEGGFLGLRQYLSDRLELVARPTAGRVPGWVLTLEEHSNLLTDKPCDRYSDELTRGQTDLLSSVCTGLDISRESWIWQEVILAYLREICGRQDNPFKKAMDGALDIAEGNTALTPSTATARVVVSAIVKRYSEAAVKPEHPRLRDASVAAIGNPWLKRQAWDAWVKHEPARQMVDSWLKSRIMEDFFMLLSDQTGNSTDKRRLDYWLQFVPVITDMWFVLGPLARRNLTPEYRAVFKRMEGRRPRLDPSQGEGNNAFIMKIGHYYFIEFGSKGNACYYYRDDELPFDLGKSALSIYDLKLNKARKTSHIPSGSWEQEFDRKFRHLMSEGGSAQPSKTVRTERSSSTIVTGSGSKPKGSQASTQPSEQPPAKSGSAISPLILQLLLKKCDTYNVRHEDLRQRGGNLWVYTDEITYPALAKELKGMGFTYTKKKPGFWLESKD